MEQQTILEPECQKCGVSWYKFGNWVTACLKIVTILAVAGYVVGNMAYGSNMTLKELLAGTMIAAGVIAGVWCWRIIRSIIAAVWRISVSVLVLWLLINGL